MEKEIKFKDLSFGLRALIVYILCSLVWKLIVLVAAIILMVMVE